MLVLGVDLGTGGARAIVLDADDGNVLARASSPVALHHPVAGASEQNPNDWWMAACSAIGTAIADAGCSGDDIKAVGLTGQMHGCTLVDANNAPIRPAILWNDQRSMEQCAPPAVDPSRCPLAHSLWKTTHGWLNPAKPMLGAGQRTRGLPTSHWLAVTQRLSADVSHWRSRNGRWRRLGHNAARSCKPAMVHRSA